MLSRGNLKRSVAAIAAGVLIGGTITTVTPAGAEVSQFAATNWKKIWKKKLAPQADKRYYKKAESDAKYTAAGSGYSKSEVDTRFGGYWTKAEADAAYQPKGSYAPTGASYTKAESDAKYAPTPSLIRGTYDIIGYANAAGAELADNVPFGWTLSAPPIPHYINKGALPPVGCSGTVEAPNAAPGHLCIFEAQDVLGNQRRVISASGFYGSTSTFGVGVTATATAAGNVYVYGSWAVRPAVPVGPQGVTAPKVPDGEGARAGN